MAPLRNYWLLVGLFMKVLRIITAIIAFGRSGYSFWYLLVAILASSGFEQPLWSTEVEAAGLARLEFWQFVVWLSYASAYLVAGILVIKPNRWALPFAVYAFAVDMSYWITMPLHQAYASLVSLADGYVDLAVNAANLFVLLGVILSTARLWNIPGIPGLAKDD